jgi:hypothetical protein
MSAARTRRGSVAVAVTDQSRVRERLYGEVTWLRQELEKGTIQLAFASTQDLYFPYALSEGLLDEWPQIRERIESLYDAVLSQ